MSAPSIQAQNQQYVAEMHEALKGIPLGKLEEIASLLERAYEHGKTVYVVGNGGSAATASHMACDFAKTTLGKRHHEIHKRLKAISLSDNMPLITAWGNDVAYEHVFEQQLRNLANEGDVLIAISASGNSPNIVLCLQTARAMGLRTVGFLGFKGGKSLELCDHAVVVESENYGVIEDLHSILNHMLTATLRSMICV